MTNLPVEVLIRICNKLGKTDVRQFLLVNKLWSKTARLFIDQDRHLALTKTSTLYEDLSKFPLLAPRVTRLTVKLDDTLYCMLTLSLCPNITHLSFDDKCTPKDLLACLRGSKYTLLPKLQDITTSGNSDELWSCIWKHRATITRIPVLPDQYSFPEYAKDLPELISHFPQVKELNALSVHDDVNLYRLLLNGKNLRKVKLFNVFYYNEGNSDDNLQTSLKEFACYGVVHINVIQVIMKMADNKGLTSRCSSTIKVDEGQDKEELLQSIFGNHKDLDPEQSKVLYEGFSPNASFLWKKWLI